MMQIRKTNNFGRVIIVLLVMISCNQQKENKEYSKLGSKFIDTMKIKTNSNISQMELNVTGNIIGRGRLVYIHTPFVKGDTIYVEGIVEEKIKTDWYDNRCLIKYEPENSRVTGTLMLQFSVP